MVRFGIGEYIKNIFYNIISVLLLAATFVACTIFTSNISTQVRVNRFFETYIDENSIMTGPMGFGFNVEEIGLTKVDKVLYSREWISYSEELEDLSTCLVYDDYTMEKLTPRLKSGKIVTDGSGEMINAIISENGSGIKVGDVIEIAFFPKEGFKEGRMIMVPVKVTGIFESGQRLFFGNGIEISRDMPMRDILGLYHYEQVGYSMVIIQEKELEKLPEEAVFESWRSVIKLQEDITKEERIENFRKLVEYEKTTDYGSNMEAFPEMSSFVERNEKETKYVFLTNLPLVIAITSLIALCIICMISIRNANSMKYYATLYICGMPLKNAMFFSGIEMAINSILAILLGTAIIEIQASREIFGEINCTLNIEQWLIIIGISVFMVVSVMGTTYKTLKEHSPMSVLRDTAY